VPLTVRLDAPDPARRGAPAAPAASPPRVRRRLAVALAALGLLAVAVPASAAPSSTPKAGPLGSFSNIVVIYEENHSFDNLYGLWGDVNGQHVVGLGDADAAHTLQKAQDGTTYDCLLQLDYNLRTVNQAGQAPQTGGPLAATCPDSTGGTESHTRGDGVTVTYDSHFANAPFKIDDYIAATDVTCPPASNLFGFSNGIDKRNTVTGATAGGCTRDLVHRFYQEQYQIDGGQMDQYVTGSDAVGTTMGYYDTTQLPVYTYLHANGAPNYVVADHFFQAAFGGSFLNHQFLIAAAAPAFSGSHSVLDANGMPRGAMTSVSPFANNYPLYADASTTLIDGNTTQTCGAGAVAGLACGDYAVNTVNPAYQPTSNFGAKIPAIDDTSTPLTIGDLLSDHGVSWAYYGGGWDNAAGIVDGRGYTNQTDGTPGGTCSDPNGPSTGATADVDGNHGWPYCPDFSYQAHHYPFAYFKRYAPGMPDRAHLEDEQDFLWAAANGQLPAVSFVKPLGNENEHPGYSSEPNGSNHLVDLIQSVLSGPQADNTLIVVTYDEFGGEWDHVTPPSASNPVAAHDWWGPGTRIPALLIASRFTRSGVDHTYYDTLSILRTIEARWHIGNLGKRDAVVNSLTGAIAKGRP
jgi:acid phosphatase